MFTAARVVRRLITEVTMSNQGKKVKTHYRGTLDDGTQFDSFLRSR